MLFSLLGVAGLYFYLSHEFLAAVQIVVYVGGIVVLIIFSIFLTHASGENMPKPIVWRALVVGLTVVFFTVVVCFSLLNHSFTMPILSLQTPMSPDIKTIGKQFLSITDYGYILPFEVVSLLLLAALIACIVIAINIKVKQ